MNHRYRIYLTMLYDRLSIEKKNNILELTYGQNYELVAKLHDNASCGTIWILFLYFFQLYLIVVTRTISRSNTFTSIFSIKLYNNKKKRENPEKPHKSRFKLYFVSVVILDLSRICDAMFHYLEGEHSRDPISGNVRWRTSGNDVVFRLGNDN
jgi:hypothetical protein